MGRKEHDINWLVSKCFCSFCFARNRSLGLCQLKGYLVFSEMEKAMKSLWLWQAALLQSSKRWPSAK